LNLMFSNAASDTLTPNEGITQKQGYH
jgi:hypothetical protein